MNNQTVTIEISKDLHEALQQVKQILSQLSWEQIQNDEDVIGILVSWFIQSLMAQWQQWQNPQQWENNSWSWIILQ